MCCISYESGPPIFVVPKCILGHKVFQWNGLDICVGWNVHDTVTEGVRPPVDQLFHELYSFFIGRWWVHGLLPASEALPVRPAQEDLAFVGIGVISRVVCRGVEKGKPHENIRLRIATLEEEGIELAHLKGKMSGIHNACAEQPHRKNVVDSA